jgi:hypothetical protein
VGIRSKLTLWQPPGETIEAIVDVLSSRWSAGRARPEGLFWPTTSCWLGQQARRLTGDGTGLTSVRAAEGS